MGRIHGSIHVGDQVYKTSDKALMQKARESFARGGARRSPVYMEVSILRAQKVQVKVEDFCYTSEIVPEISEKQPLSREKVMSQFAKTGNTPFEVAQIQLTLDEGLFLPVSVMNEIRRNALEAYAHFLLAEKKASLEPVLRTPLPRVERYQKYSKEEAAKNKKVSVFFQALEEWNLEPLHNVDCFYFRFKDALKNRDLIEKMGGKKYIVLPLVTRANYAELIKKNVESMSQYADGFVLSHIGQLKYMEGMRVPSHKSPELIANYTFNTFNTYSLEALASLGFSKVLLSPELTKEQINALGGSLEREVIAYGSLCVMTSAYCPVGAICGGFTANTKCSMPCTKGDKFFLRDRMNMDFRVLPDNVDCDSQIFNSKITSIKTSDLNVDSICIALLDEGAKEAQRIIDVHRNGEKLAGDQYTNGHLNRPV